MSFKRNVRTALVAFISAFAAVAVFNYFGLNKQQVNIIEQTPQAKLAAFMSPHAELQPIDFRYSAAVSTPCVVHIKSTYKPQRTAYKGNEDPFRELFGDNFQQFFHGPNPYQSQPEIASGSGVIVSSDGYIVTNNHVVDNADEVEVVLSNNKTYKAKVIGKDPDTDIALVKIEGSNLPSIQFANSDSVLVGEWVLAVGNPFNLSSTVTAGIVSAKGRNIDLHGDDVAPGTANTSIEAFIQTDAAVNPGNSGGALVNVNGQLVGINTAIASPTGSYAGYSFAVPSNIVKKVVFDLEKFGISQRGFLGVTIKDMDDESAKEVGFDKPYGVFVQDVNKGSAGEVAGLKSKDVITKINGFEVNSSPELQEQIAQYRPGDKISVEYIRDGKTYTAEVILKNKYNTTASVDNSQDVLGALGVKVENLTPSELQSLGLNGGVRITELEKGKLSEFTDIRKGFIITQIDDQTVNNTQDFINIMKDKTGKVLIEGIYPNRPASYMYAFRM